MVTKNFENHMFLGQGLEKTLQPPDFLHVIIHTANEWNPHMDTGMMPGRFPDILENHAVGYACDFSVFFLVNQLAVHNQIVYIRK